MKSISFIVILSAFLFVCSCNSPEKGTAESKDEKKVEQTFDEDVVADRPADSKGKFLVKSAIIEFDSEIIGMKQSMTMCIDKWGELSFVEMQGELMGMKSHNISLIKDGFEYTIDMTKKTGTKKPYILKNNPEDIDFSALSPEIMKEFGMTKEGTEVFLGKKCDKYSVNNSLTKMKGYYLVWKGIPLKTEVSVTGMSIKMTAKKIDLNAAIPSTKFDIPAGIKITEEAVAKNAKK